MKTTLLTGWSTLVLSALATGQTHTHGAFVGTLQPNSAVVWTRSSSAALVSVVFNTSPTTANANETPAVSSSANHDFTVRIRLTGLKPATKYYYTTRVANPKTPTSNVLGPWQPFTTAPSGGNVKFTFLTSGDIFDKAAYGILDSMRKHPGSFFLGLGDMCYAYSATTQALYWQRHRETREHKSWIPFAAQFPIESSWDDPEVENDWDAASNAQLVAFGVNAFRDYFPIPDTATEIYRTIPWGSGAELFLLDCRSHRGVNEAPQTPNKSMLGSTQKAWLKSALLASKATFKILCTSVPIRYGKQGLDDWSGYVRERQEILDFILANGIQNVVVLSADSHIISIHDHREGIREFQVGPLAQIMPPQTPAGPEVRFRTSVLNFAAVTVDPTVTPATLTVEYFDKNNNKVHTEVVEAEASPARGEVVTDVANGDSQLDGPHYFHHRGRGKMPRVPPGTYTVSFDPRPGNVQTPADLVLPIPAGSEFTVSARWRDVPGPAVLFADTFDAPLSGYAVLDESGSTNGPSAWFTAGGELVKGSRIDGPVGSVDADRPGTILTTGSASWSNYTTAVRLLSHDRGRIGVVFRYQDKDNFYRFVVDEQRPLQRLEKKVKGTYTTLAQRTIPYLPHNHYDVRCIADGSTLKVIVDDLEIFKVKDSSFSNGKVGLYVWQNKLTRFDDLVVTQGADYTPPVNAAMIDHFEDGKLTGWSIQDHATQSGASSWVENVGVMMQLSNIGDVDSNKPLAQPGTVCVSTATIPADMQFTLDMVNYDDDGMGLVFRYKDAGNHYRFRWDRASRIRTLEKVVNGNWSPLWSDANQYNPRQWYRVRVLAVGTRLRLYLDGELLADVTDNSHTSGTVGLYSWRSTPLLFDRALVQKPHEEVPVLAAVTHNRVTTLYGRSPRDANAVYGLALALSRTPAIPLSWLNSTDPRVIELAPDFIFLESLKPGPLWTGLQGKTNANGELSATIQWPPLPSLKGTKFYAGGWTGDLRRNPVKSVIPTVGIVFP